MTIIDKRFQRFREAYLRMAREADYRPDEGTAPTLRAEADKFARHFVKMVTMPSF